MSRSDTLVHEECLQLYSKTLITVEFFAKFLGLLHVCSKILNLQEPKTEKE